MCYVMNVWYLMFEQTSIWPNLINAEKLHSQQERRISIEIQVLGHDKYDHGPAYEFRKDYSDFSSKTDHQSTKQ